MVSSVIFSAAIFKDNRGYALVEAAVIFPIVVTTVALIISCGLFMMNHVKDDALYHKDQVQEALEKNILTTENVFRGEWLLDEN